MWPATAVATSRAGAVSSMSASAELRQSPSPGGKRVTEGGRTCLGSFCPSVRVSVCLSVVRHSIRIRASSIHCSVSYLPTSWEDKTETQVGSESLHESVAWAPRGLRGLSPGGSQKLGRVGSPTQSHQKWARTR